MSEQCPAITTNEADAIVDQSRAPRVTREAVEAKISRKEFLVRGTLTICILTTESGFQVVGEAACADPRNFDAAVGERYAYDAALRRLWAFEGYLLCDRQHMWAARMEAMEAFLRGTYEGLSQRAAAEKDKAQDAAKEAFGRIGALVVKMLDEGVDMASIHCGLLDTLAFQAVAEASKYGAEPVQRGQLQSVLDSLRDCLEYHAARVAEKAA